MHLAVQSAFIKVCERRGRSKDLTEFEGDIEMRFQQVSLFNFFPAGIPRSEVSGIIAKWKCLEVPATPPQSA